LTSGSRWTAGLPHSPASHHGTPSLITTSSIRSRKRLEELIHLGSPYTTLPQQEPQPGILGSHGARSLLHLQRRQRRALLVVLDPALQVLDVGLVALAGAALVVAHAGGIASARVVVVALCLPLHRQIEKPLMKRGAQSLHPPGYGLTDSSGRMGVD
jgi:hypothetical protein